MFRLIVALLFLAPSLWSQGYTPLTDAQAKAYVLKVGPDELAQEIIRLDSIEHSTPVFTLPELVLIEEKNGVIAYSWADPARIHISVAKDALQYDIPLKPGTSHLKIKNESMGMVFAVLAGTTIAAAGGWTLARWPEYGVPTSAIAGALTSWLMYTLLK